MRRRNRPLAASQLTWPARAVLAALVRSCRRYLPACSALNGADRNSFDETHSSRSGGPCAGALPTGMMFRPAWGLAGEQNDACSSREWRRWG